MKRTHTILAGLLTLAASASTVAVAQGAQRPVTTARAAKAAKVTLRHSDLGMILTTSSGFTLYEFTRDHGKTNSCVKISMCSGTWPALQTTGRPTAGPGVKSSMLSTTTLPNGKRQVTYAGHPLYTYDGDTGPAETFYVGEKAFGGNWYAINASGHSVK